MKKVDTEEISNLEKILSCFGKDGQPVVLSFYLGSMFGLGVGLFFLSSYFGLGIFLIGVSFFHLWEYLYVAIFRSKEIHISYFLIDHSFAFVVSYIFSYVEYFVGRYYFPWLKGNKIIIYFAAVGMLIGQIFRTGSMIQCGRKKEHKLVTTGFYKYFRHPSYFGWYLWVVSSQLVLCNPLSFLGYCFVAYKFFKDRIECEEYFLKRLFGKDYENYMKNVGTHIPFIK